MAKEIKIQIDSAKISTISITFPKEPDEIPVVSVWISLMANKVEIARFNASTNAWEDEKKFDLSMEMQILIQKIALDLEKNVTALCQSQTKELSCT